MKLKFVILSIVLLMLFFFSACKNDVSSDPLDSTATAASYFPPAASSNWETISPQSLGWNLTELNSLSNFLSTNGTRAFLILKDGRIAAEYYFGTNIIGTNRFGASSIWYWASAGKTLTAFTALIARENNFLSLTNRTSDFLGSNWSSLSSAQQNLITIRHQLTMTSGLDDSVADRSDFSASNLIYLTNAGLRWAYHNAPYTLLEEVITQAVSDTFDNFFNTKLRDLTGMDGTWYWNANDHVYYSTARSMARFGILMLNRGSWNGTEILSNKVYFDEMINTSQSLNASYGYLWWLNGKSSFMLPGLQTVFSGQITSNAPADMYAAMGKNGQILNIVPSEKLIVVRMGDNPDSALVSLTLQNQIWDFLKLIRP